MNPITAFIITIVAIMFSGLFSGTEIAFMQSSKVRIGIDASKGGIINRIISGFNRHQDMFISSILVGNNIVLVIYGIAISVIINPWIETWCHNEAAMLILNTLISTTIILITGEFLPKASFRINPNTTLKVFAVPVFLTYVILYPVSWLTSALSRGLMRIFGISKTKNTGGQISIDQLDDYIQQAMDENTETEAVENEVKIFRNAIDFKDTHIRDCMIPRNEITAVNILATSRQQLLKLFVSTGLSKIVVYRDNIDEVLGYIHISELFNPETDWKQHLKPVLFTPETMLANKMMRRLLAEKKSMAIVVDEFGGTAGLVTLEDLVEEIFGEIEDEHDRQKLVARQISEDSYLFSGRVEVERINEEFHLDLKESEEYQTIAGYILDNLEQIPAQGAVFDIDYWQFTVMRTTASRIELIGMKRLPREPE